MITLTRGGLIGATEQTYSKQSIVITNYEKSAEAIVPRERAWKGLSIHLPRPEINSPTLKIVVLAAITVGVRVARIGIYLVSEGVVLIVLCDSRACL